MRRTARTYCVEEAVSGFVMHDCRGSRRGGGSDGFRLDSKTMVLGV